GGLHLVISLEGDGLAPHFDITVWCDFARGLIRGRRGTMLQSHLNVCRECGDVTERLTRLWSFASEERKNRVPADVVNAARLIYDRADFDLSIMNLGKRVRPRLVFDSFSAVTSAGVRTGNRSDRHCVYRAGHVLVDLVLEYVRETNEVVVIGQITNAK